MAALPVICFSISVSVEEYLSVSPDIQLCLSLSWSERITAGLVKVRGGGEDPSSGDIRPLTADERGGGGGVRRGQQNTRHKVESDATIATRTRQGCTVDAYDLSTSSLSCPATTGCALPATRARHASRESGPDITQRAPSPPESSSAVASGLLVFLELTSFFSRKFPTPPS